MWIADQRETKKIWGKGVAILKKKSSIKQPKPRADRGKQVQQIKQRLARRAPGSAIVTKTRPPGHPDPKTICSSGGCGCASMVLFGFAFLKLAFLRSEIF
jgi:hypothetical protein